jgi:histidine triad (HIT) family protein
MPDPCIFCDIIQGNTPAEFVYKGDSVVAFKDIHPHAPVHILVVPKKHIRSINDLSEDDGPVMAEMIMRAQNIAQEFGIAQSGYKLVCNVERGGGQYVFHLHLHVVGGW